MLDLIRSSLMLTVACLAVLPLVGCGVDVTEADSGGKTEVNVRTPVGAVSVQTNVDMPDTGLPVYEGARILRSGDEPGSANVSVAVPFVDVKVVAAKFEHDDEPEAILAFYRTAMSKYGDVVECRGDIDFKRRDGLTRPVCDQRRSARDIQLVVGSEERHRLVLVKPRGSGSEFSVVHIQTTEG